MERAHPGPPTPMLYSDAVIISIFLTHKASLSLLFMTGVRLAARWTVASSVSPQTPVHVHPRTSPSHTPHTPPSFIIF